LIDGGAIFLIHFGGREISRMVNLSAELYSSGSNSDR
jgi:hypothetical protein